MTAVDAISTIFRYNVLASEALGYNEPEGEKKDPEDIAADLDQRDRQLEDALTAVGGAATDTATWVDYTPSFTNFTIGNGTITRARYKATSTTIVVEVMVTLGGTSVMGTGPTVSVPVNSSPTGGTSGSASYLDGTTPYAGSAVIDGSDGTVALAYSGGAVTATAPFTFGSGDTFRFHIEYERA